MHIVTLSFDDGLLKSNLKIADIYERYGVSACFNIIAGGYGKSFTSPDKWHIGFEKGGFDVWNELQARGHEIMPHGYKHANKAKTPFDEAKKLITDCLAVFSQELDGFTPEEAVFNFPYNHSTPELEVWLPSVVKAFRTSGDAVNPLPHPGQVKLTTDGYGPDNCEEHLDNEIERLLSLPSGWLIYNTHGLDEEGWGPIGAEYLDRLLDRLLSVSTVCILPAGKALEMDDKGEGEVR